MVFVGEEINDLEFAFFVSFAVIAFTLFIIQAGFLQKLRMLPVILLPAISFLICFENCVLTRGSSLGKKSALAVVTLILHAMILPLMVLTMFELPFRLHQARTAHFLCIPFEQGVISRDIAKCALWGMRLMAVGLFVVNILVNFDTVAVHKNSKSRLTGYTSFGKKYSSLQLWMSLLPAVFLSILAIVIAMVMQRYARNFSLGVRTHNFHWRYLLPLSLGYAVSRCFNTYYFAVISNAGDLCILIALTVLTYRLQLDLAVAGSFADFLHRSNVVFRSSHAMASSPSPPDATAPGKQNTGARRHTNKSDIGSSAGASLEGGEGNGVAMTEQKPSEEMRVRTDDVKVSLEPEGQLTVSEVPV